ncbi:MAG: succinate dehydrogenase, cytochrome b556 subunit [Sulfuricella sp.]|nr:succinate dehydrogenase, cytochrome b556 subunit [Sulfuricella sp.]
MANRRPKYLNLLRIRLPLPGVVSLLHRISGALLFVAIPLFLAVFRLTLDSPAGFETVRQGLESPLAKLVLIGLLWGYSHHFFAGLRFLAMDMQLGLELGASRRNSLLVMVLSSAFTVLIGAALW